LQTCESALFRGALHAKWKKTHVRLNSIIPLPFLVERWAFFARHGTVCGIFLSLFTGMKHGVQRMRSFL
jgi:hypothetical protein